jgi:hypothetical protein
MKLKKIMECECKADWVYAMPGEKKVQKRRKEEKKKEIKRKSQDWDGAYDLGNTFPIHC